MLSPTRALSSALLLALLATPSRGQSLVADINPGASGSSPSSLIAFGDTLIFRATDATRGSELWRSDSTSGGTVLVADINPGAASSNPSNLLVVGNTLYFTATDGSNGVELWKTDGTTVGTSMVADLNPGAGSASPTSLVAFGSLVMFAATDGATGRELWLSDGTSAGTVLFADINVGAGSSSPANLLVVGPFLYFSATTNASGTELWQALPPVPGTAVQVADIAPGTASSSPSELIAIGLTLYFRATDGTSGIELWKSDGSTAGTVLVADINPGSVASGTGSLAANELTLFFTASDGRNGTELWQSTPPWTSATTTMVRDINPGSGSGIPASATRATADLLYPAAHNPRIVFSGTDGVAGAELWVSDGNATGTLMVADINPGAGAANPANFIRVGGRVYFTATDGTTGVELWTARLRRISGALAEAFGTGCPGTAALVPVNNGVGVPTLGNSGFALRVSAALPNSAGVLAIDGVRGNLAVGGGCTLYVPGVLVTFPAATDASGAGIVAMGIPNQPALVGADFVTQWAILDPGGRFLGQLSLSNGVQVVVGN